MPAHVSSIVSHASHHPVRLRMRCRQRGHWMGLGVSNWDRAVVAENCSNGIVLQGRVQGAKQMTQRKATRCNTRLAIEDERPPSAGVTRERV